MRSIVPGSGTADGGLSPPTEVVPPPPPLPLLPPIRPPFPWADTPPLPLPLPLPLARMAKIEDPAPTAAAGLSQPGLLDLAPTRISDVPPVVNSAGRGPET